MVHTAGLEAGGEEKTLLPPPQIEPYKSHVYCGGITPQRKMKKRVTIKMHSDPDWRCSYSWGDERTVGYTELKTEKLLQDFDDLVLISRLSFI